METLIHNLAAGYEAEIEHEENAFKRGLEEFRTQLLKVKQGQRETEADYGRNLLARSVHPLSMRLTEILHEAVKKPGRKTVSVKRILGLEADVVAFITAREVVDGVTKAKRSLLSLSLQVAGRIQDEVNFQNLEEHETPDGRGGTKKGAIFKGVHRQLKKNPQSYKPHVRRANLIHAMRKFGVGVEEWPKTDLLHLGRFLVGLFMETTGLVQFEKRPCGVIRKGKKMAPKRETCVVPSPALLEWVDKYNAHSEVFCSELVPMISPPKPWAGVSGGGYYTNRMLRPLVKPRTKGYLSRLSEHKMPDVYAGVNALQATPWKVNTAFLTVFQELWEGGVECEGLPRREDEAIPAKPDYEADPTAWVKWKQEATNIGRANHAAGSKRIQAKKIRQVAERHAHYPAIWFPIQLDFRGRVYCVPKYLNPQGCDLAKALLMFAEGKPLGPRGVHWLAVHVANCFGYDKVPLEERAKWTFENSKRIEGVANDPLGDLWWTEADGGKKPFQFLAACIEWLGYLQDGGENYICSLPIMVDGSCNGIQHFAAMMRDETAGREVNLVPGKVPADIYAKVASLVEDKLRQESHDVVKSFACQWLDYPITRKTVKRPVMVLPYSGTREAVLKYLFEHVENAKKNPFGKEKGKAVIYLRDIVWEAMHEVVKRPREVMDWLKKIAALTSDRDKTIEWRTPSGFLVEQRYADTRTRIVDTREGSRIYFFLKEETEGLDKKKQGQAVSPNFVHSMDASALMLTVVDAVRMGINRFAAIHDSYGTLATDMDTLQKCLRETFVSMYERHDVLSEFSEGISKLLPAGVRLPPIPPQGGLKLSDVRDSEFFFA